MQILCPQKTGEQPSNTAIETKCNLSKGNTYLQTAVATLQNPKSKSERRGRLLLDSGSQRSYITERMATLLGLATVEEDVLQIYTFGASSPQETVSPCTEVIVETKRGDSRKLHVNIVPHIANRVPVPKVKANAVDVLADDLTCGLGIDLLVGNDFYCSFLREDKVKLDTNLYLIDTQLGWILSGNLLQEGEANALTVTTYCECHIPSCPYFTEPDLPLRSTYRFKVLMVTRKYWNNRLS